MPTDLDTFLSLPTHEVAQIVSDSGHPTCVFNFENTRRWFAAEYGSQQFDDPYSAYLKIVEREYLRVFEMLFEHGFDTIVSPVFDIHLFERGEEYMQKIAADGLAHPAVLPEFLNFYDKNEVRVRFYGEHRKRLTNTQYGHLSDLFEQATARTISHQKRRLFWGMFVTDAAEAVAEFAVQYHAQHKKSPTHREIVEMYYGEYVNQAALFISSDKFRVSGYPLLSSGKEDLYYTIAPLLYFSELQLRHILYDHLFARKIDHSDYTKMPSESLDYMKNFYGEHRNKTLGVGKLVGQVWYPLC